jgi:hypothetical protein
MPNPAQFYLMTFVFLFFVLSNFPTSSFSIISSFFLHDLSLFKSFVKKEFTFVASKAPPLAFLIQNNILSA